MITKRFLSNPNIFTPGYCKSLIFQTLTIRPDIFHSLKYQRSTTPGCKVIGIRTIGFVIIAQLFKIFLVQRYTWNE